VVEILEDIPVYSSVLQEKVTGNRFILRFASRLSAITYLNEKNIV
jgi:hypothetical protein